MRLLGRGAKSPGLSLFCRERRTCQCAPGEAMVARDGSKLERNRREVRNLILERLNVLRRQEDRIQSLPLKQFYMCQESILEEVLHRAHGHLDSQSLVNLVDLCIHESRVFGKLSTDKGLKSFHGLRIRILRSFLVLAKRKLSLRGWWKRRASHRRHPR